jgi:electron transfer flavoprotein alpha subunit
MEKLIIHQEKISDLEEFIKICPFHAIELINNTLTITAGCKMCRLCVKNSKNGEVEYIKEEKTQIDKSIWNGICVLVDHEQGEIHPVTLELVGKAQELAKKINHKVYCLFIGDEITEKAEELLYYGADEIFVYDNKALRHFVIEPYTAVFEDFINKVKPSVILVGATPVGRQLAPRVAARFKTGLTADCTVLDIMDNTDLIQIRPAFGGNIMAQILTPNSRPQMATVRYKVMNAPQRSDIKKGKITSCEVKKEFLKSGIEVLSISEKPRAKTIENAEVIVVAGRGVKTKEDVELIQELADAIGGELACTRPLAETGWVESKRQIGLSGRTVRPKLIITCGVSGAVQFAAGMKSSETIFAINKDEKAPIFKVAHYGVVGDIYEIVPKMIKLIREERESHAL